MRIKSVDVVVPAGQYVLGDPCYAVPDENWDELLESCNYFENPVGYIRLDDFHMNKTFILGFPTRWGDGQYKGSNGMSYPVDAGLIGLVPVDIAKDLESHYQNIVTFTKDTICSHDGSGRLVFGGISIETDPAEEEEDETV
jgi:hypothetical protein